MRRDRYRINGPDSTWINAIKETEVDGRSDNRSMDQMRSLFGAVGIIAKANGSALMEAHKIKVVCAVHIKHSSLIRSDSKAYFDFKFAPFATLKRSGFIKVKSICL